MFAKGSHYTRVQIHDRLGGGIQDYLPHRNGEVVAGCFDPGKNPSAPEIVLPGNGPEIQRWADAVAEQRNPIPIFLKDGTHKWRYVGDYRAVRCSRDPEEVRRHAASVPDRDTITRVLFFEPV